MRLEQMEFETRHAVHLVRKDQDYWMRLIGWFYPAWMTDWWTTYRLPGQVPRICYPVDVREPYAHPLAQHELVHAEQQRSAWGLLVVVLLTFLFPLPVLWSGRWYLERPAYLLDIRKGYRSPESAAESLWTGYLWPYPKSWMVRWFRENS